ncbi:MAG: hypothetical protein R3272_11435 [Candidatus Promineifilaceae bacterium]|nr:hypothetical protein [Candidatus Promineifilaceae bacterium]
MKSELFLTCFENGIARAAGDGNGGWSVELLARDHRVSCLAADPADARLLFAGTTDGVLRSDDGGLTWRAAGMAGKVVKSLAVSPHDGDVVYAGTKPARIFDSRDGGHTWREQESFRRIPNRWWWFSPAEPPDLRAYVIAIAPSPTEPGVLLAGVEFGAVVRSEDGGETWSRHRSGSLRDCHSLKFHAADGGWVYEAGGTGGGAAYSRDGGRTFHKVREGLAKNYGIVCAADPETPEQWYVCVARGPGEAYGASGKVYLYRTRDGAQWQPIGWQPHPLRASITALVTVPGAPGHLYAGLYNGDIWHSDDYGDSWAQMPFSFDGIWHSLLVL